MLRTNSKKARENLRAYIAENYDPSNYEREAATTFEGIASDILQTFRAEKFYSDNYMRKHKIPEFQSFVDWCAGLPSILDTCYYYNRSAVDDLGTILEETEKEKTRFNESQAEELLSKLIYNELIKAEVK